jgi:hypothetical protein
VAGLETSTWFNNTYPITTSQAYLMTDTAEVRRAGKNSSTNRSTIAVRTHYL